MSCRPKEQGCDDCGQLIPPFGVIASAVGGELVFFDLDDLHIIRNESMSGWATACELIGTGSRLVSTDNDAGAFSIFSVPELDRIEYLSIGGTPIDLRVAQNFLTAHMITNNARYYRISLGSLIADTLDTGSSPRRIKLRPPSDFFAWIPCVGDSSIRVVKEQGFFEQMRIDLDSRCTDIEFSPDGLRAYCALPEVDQLLVLDADTGDRIDDLPMPGTVVDVDISSEGRYVMTVDSAHGDSRVYDLVDSTSHDLRCGTSAMRVRYSLASRAFFVICPQENMLLRVDPTSAPPQVTDTLLVEPTPQCFSFLEY